VPQAVQRIVRTLTDSSTGCGNYRPGSRFTAVMCYGVDNAERDPTSRRVRSSGKSWHLQIGRLSRYPLLGPDFHRQDRTSLQLAHSLDHLVSAGDEHRWHHDSGRVTVLRLNGSGPAPTCMAIQVRTSPTDIILWSNWSR
jgi:hypothetical protein